MKRLLLAATVASAGYLVGHLTTPPRDPGPPPESWPNHPVSGVTVVRPGGMIHFRTVPRSAVTPGRTCTVYVHTPRGEPTAYAAVAD